MAILGHTTLKQAEVYTRHANRKRMAGDGMAQFAAAMEAENIMGKPTQPPTARTETGTNCPTFIDDARSGTKTGG